MGSAAATPLVSTPMAVATRLGRPPATSSVETRARILEAARHKFAAHGYESTSNRALAKDAGLTTGAIYHYFDSKLDIYVAVYDEAQRHVFTRFQAAIEGERTFKGQLEATLEEAHQLDCEDPTLAQFLGSSRVDAARDAQLATALRQVKNDRRREFFAEMVEVGVRSGEIDPEHRPMITALLRTLVVGLTDAVSGDRAKHRAAVDAIRGLLAGTLIKPPR